MQSMLRLEGELFLLAVRYLTRLPVPRDLPQSDDLMVRSVKYHPAVGLLVGAIGAAVLLVGAQVLPWTVAVILSLAATVLVTAGFHEAGLADAAEGLAVGRDRSEVMQVMDRRKPGTYGALALGLVIALKLALLADMTPALAAAVLVAGHVVGRMAYIHVTWSTVHARSEGLQKVVPKVTRDGYRVALATTLAVLAGAMTVAGPLAMASGFVGAILLGQIFRAYITSRIGGYTGDCLGGEQQLAELGLYLGVGLVL